MSKPWGTAEFKRAFELEIRTLRLIQIGAY